MSKFYRNGFLPLDPDEPMRDFNVYQFLDVLRERPALWLGDHSLTRLDAFLQGCWFMGHVFFLDCRESPPFGKLHDWVAQRLGWGRTSAGWCTIILHECGGDERRALDRFFELLDEYRRGG